MPPLTFLWLSTTDWDAPQFGSRQQLAQRLAGRGHRVLFVEVPRSLHSFISDPVGTRRALRRLGQVREEMNRREREERREEEGGRLCIYTPRPVLPIYYHPVTNNLNQRLLTADLRRTLSKLGWKVDVWWTYWPNTAAQVGRFGERLAVYHCIDDFTAVSYPLTPPGAIGRMEAALCRQANLIFTRTEGLAAVKKELNPNTQVLPGGVDTAHFDPAAVSQVSADVAALPRPRVGFLGTIDDRLDVALLAACAQALPEVAFVLAGPIKHHLVELNQLRALANVHFLPARPHSQVPATIAGFDIGLIPYQRTPYTEGLSPIKLYEYLAMGKPVVATDLPYLRRESEQITIARTTADFIAALRQRLAQPATATEQAQWRATAEANSWDRQVDEIENYLKQTTDKHG
jgi:glycosyltransferase involved in cell wall biosynthesis